MTLAGVAGTAVATARARAAETARPDALVRDPHAAPLVAALGGPADGPGDRRLAVHVVLRTWLYDRELLAAVGRGVEQVVLVGAGLDTRAWRLPLAGTVVWELDQPEVLRAKQSALSTPPLAERRAVPADLAAEGLAPLAGAEHDAGRPTAWVVEGLLAYLDEDDAGRLLDAVTARSAPGSLLVTEAGATTRDGDRSGVRALWRGGLPDPADHLRRSGWHVEEHPLATVAEAAGRPLPGARSALLAATR